MKNFQLKLSVKLEGKVYTMQKQIKAKTFANAAKRGIEWHAKLCPLDYESATQIAVRVKRKLR